MSKIFKAFWSTALVRLVASAAVLATLSGASLAQQEGLPENSSGDLQSRQVGVNTRIERLGSTWQQTGSIRADQSRIVVYRHEAGSLSGVTRVFVNGLHHTSLVPGSYNYFCYKPGDLEIGARQMKAGSQAKDPMDSISVLNLRPAKTHYLRVTEQGGHPVLQPVDEDVALDQLQVLHLQVHTVSWMARALECREQANAVAATPVRQVTLAADALFAFGQSDADAILPAGRSSSLAGPTHRDAAP